MRFNKNFKLLNVKQNVKQLFSGHTKFFRQKWPKILLREKIALCICVLLVFLESFGKPENKRFDHHQREFCETMESLKILKFKTKLSSAGLVYAYYGKAVISQLSGVPQDSPKMELLYEKVDLFVCNMFVFKTFYSYIKNLLKNLMELTMALTNLKVNRNMTLPVLLVAGMYYTFDIHSAHRYSLGHRLWAS